MVAQLQNKNYHMLADEETVTVLDGTAHFTGNHAARPDLHPPDDQRRLQ